MRLVLFFLFSVVSLNIAAIEKFEFSRVSDIEQSKYQALLEFSDSEIQKLLDELNNTLKLKQSILIVAGAEDGPLYDGDAYEILMPDDFAIETYETFKQAEYVETEEELYEVTIDVIAHTIFHEAGHALVHQLELPITGKEEDAVDNLATILLLNTYEEGDQVALSAADIFAIYDQDKDEFAEEDFWGEHSVDIERFYNGICLIYGSEPEEYEDLLIELDIDEERAEMCIEDYVREERSWFTLLKPYMK